ncbi:MAG: M50 family metallopeptidase [Thermoguttaceae bacterium]
MRKRTHQLLLIGTFLPLCWLAMQAIHELGHVAIALATGGVIEKVVLHPLTISRTDSSGSFHPLLVVWAGPVIGVVVPLAVLALFEVARAPWRYLVRFFAGTCLIANGAYIGAGSFHGIGDAGDLLRLGSPMGSLGAFGLVTVAPGLYLWNGLGPCFGLGRADGKVDPVAAYSSAALLLVVVLLEATLSPYR